MKIKLSYSTLNNVRACHHFWVCKQSRLPAKDFPWFHEGRIAHDTIQKHVSAQEIHDGLFEAGITLPEFYFSEVETKDFDENMKFEFEVNDKYSFIGFLDGRNPDKKRFLEIKTSKKPWTLKDFMDSFQRKIYAKAYPDYTSAVLITSTRDLKDIQKYRLPLTQKDREDATKWIMEGIEILEKGTFDGGDDVNCRFCVYQDNCSKSDYK